MEENLRCWNFQYVTNVCMDWLSKTFRSSSSRFLEGEYHGAYREDTYWDYGQPISVDLWSGDNNEYVDRAIALFLSEKKHKRQKDAQLEKDELLAKAIRESLTINSPPYYEYGNIFQLYLSFLPLEFRIYASSGSEIGHGQYLSCMEGFWHPDCSRYHKCNELVVDHEFSISGDRSYHTSGYRVSFHPKCDVCNVFISQNVVGLIE
ncbi:hypothetical protein Nepgr_014188 [Nepenthes gracilis]|uniref:Uncharacterized protein n=1 Tax=Nepenthes gracilis TaxID=150966 RepID=A0AAD3SKQ2_NEPGR|nr:hypothetical protein Nepgr_014188 [Nepenthes gracilis]